MIKKRTTKVALAIFAIAIASIAVSEYSSQAIGNNGTPPTGRSGSPADGSNCSNCHGSATTSYTTSITSNIPSTGYISGQTYTISVSASSGSTTRRFGFEVSPQMASTPRTFIGTMATLDNTTQVQSTGWVTHKNGQAGTSYTWKFKWTAPGSSTQTAANATTNKGNGNFYGSILIADNNLNNGSGDHPQQTNTPITENTTASVVITASATTICSGASTSFTATPTNGGGAPTYLWKVNGSAASGTNNAITYTSTGLANNDVVTCVLTSNKTGVTGSPATSNSITMTVNSGSSTLTGTSTGSRCGTGTVTLGATASSGTISWYAASTGGSSIGSGASFTTPSITATTNYYVEASSGCPTVSRTMVTATVNTAPTVTNTAPASRCDAGTVTLGATASAGNINWYAAATGGSSLFTGTSFLTPGISNTTTYYVDADDGTCVTSTRTAINATIAGGPSITGTTTGSRCASGTVNLGATASAGTINWYDVPTGGTSIGNGISFVTPSISTSTSYYVDAFDGTCTTTSRTSVVATVNNLPSASISGSGTVCTGASSNISIVLTGLAPWTITYVSAAGPTTVPGINVSTYTTNVSAGTYTISTVTDGNNCSGTSSGSATVTENTPISVSNLVSVCSGGSYTVDFDLTGGDAASYVINGDAGTLTGSHFTSNPISSGTSYSFTPNDIYNCNTTAQTGTKNCSCAASADISGGGTICNGSVATITITLGGTFPWRFTYAIEGVSQPEVTGITSPTYTFTTSTIGVYTLKSMADGNCPGSISGSASVLQALPTATLSGNATICADGSTANLNIALSGNQPWSYTLSDGTTSTPLTSNIPNFTLARSTAGTYTITSISDAGCAGTSSGSATIIVNPLPSVSIIVSPSATVCAGTYITLNGSGAASYVWTGGVTDGTLFAPSNLTYTVTGTDGNSCSNKATRSITVNSLPTVGSTAFPSATVCTGTNVILSGTGTAAGYTWSGGIINGQLFTPVSPASYTVTGTDVNNCTNSSIVNLSVSSCSNPAASVVINTSQDSICLYDFSGVSITTFTATPTNGGTSPHYQWQLNSVNTGTDSPLFSATGLTNNDVVQVIMTSDLVGVTGSPATSNTISVVVTNVSTPTIIRPAPGNHLISSATTGNLWYYNGQPIVPNEVNQSLTLTQFSLTGDYSVIVTVNGCSVGSAPFNIINTGVDDITSDTYFNVLPNPNDGNFIVFFDYLIKTTYTLEVKNMLGESLFQVILNNFSGASSQPLSIAEYGKGIYFISLTSHQGSTIKKIIVY